MTEQQLRQQVVSQARAWLGRKEADGGHREIIDVYNGIRPLPAGYAMRYTDPWCAAFVSAVGQKCGLSKILFPECSCDRMIALYQKAGRWEENDAYHAKPGDLIFYDWQDTGVGDNRGSADHVGLVAEDTGTGFRVIEGNISDSVGYRTVAKNGRFIRGFALPDYAAMATGAESQTGSTTGQVSARPTVADKATAELRYSVKVPLVQLGDKGEWVRALQILLIGRKYSCGGAGADGDFGYATKMAVLNWQRTHGLTVDGKAGGETWASVLGG